MLTSHPLLGISFRRELGHSVMCANNSTKLGLPEPIWVPCRPLQPQDKADLIAAHRAAFPINYENGQHAQQRLHACPHISDSSHAVRYSLL